MTTSKQIVVYITAKREYAEYLQNLKVDGIHFNARWPHMIGRGDRPVTHWLRENFVEAINAHYVMFYAQPQDDLNTSLIEIGHAMGYNKKIVLAGSHKKFMPWAAFDNVTLRDSIQTGITFIKKDAFGPARIVGNDGSIA